MTAHGLKGRRKAPQTVTGTGETEEAALVALDDRLRGDPKPDGGRLEAMRRRLGLDYVDGVEVWAQEGLGRPLGSDEPSRLIGRYGAR